MSWRRLGLLVTVVLVIAALVAPVATAQERAVIPGTDLFCNGVEYDPTNPSHRVFPDDAGWVFVPDPNDPGGILAVADYSGEAGPLVIFEDWNFWNGFFPNWEGGSLITGTTADDVICAGIGNDTVKGGGGNDMIFGEWGYDWLWGQTGNDTIFTGFSPNDPLFWEFLGDARYVDNPGDFDDFVHGGAGNDTLVGGFDEQLIYGGPGNDEIWALGTLTEDDIEFDARVYGDWNQGDVSRGNSGDDVIYNLLPEDEFADHCPIYVDDCQGWYDDWFGAPDARPNGGPYFPWAFGGDGNDTIYGQGGVGFGNAGDDVLMGSDGSAVAGAYDLDDDEFLHGGPGDDNIWGGDDWDELVGGPGADVIAQAFPVDVGDDGRAARSLDQTGGIIQGNAGADTIFGDNGPDYIKGGSGNDTIYGFGSAFDLNDERSDSRFHEPYPPEDWVGEWFNYYDFDLIFGQDGDDYIEAGPGYFPGPDHDAVFGFNGNDTILGGDDDDYLEGGLGADEMYGGSDDDELYAQSYWFYVNHDDLTGLIPDPIGDGAPDAMFGGKGDDNFYSSCDDMEDSATEYINEGWDSAYSVFQRIGSVGGGTICAGEIVIPIPPA